MANRPDEHAAIHELKGLLRAHGLRPKRSLGQNFLVNSEALQTIVGSLGEARGAPRVVEIGPGLGVLTAQLLARGFQVLALEIDRTLIPVLKTRFQRQGGTFSILETSALDHGWLETLGPHEQPRVVGNIPYNISTPLLFHLIEHRHLLGPATLMLQHELAARLQATPGSKAYGALSVLLQLHADVQKVLELGPDSFFPKPKVDSAVLEFRWRPAPVQIEDLDFFRRVVRAAFSKRRKMLRNALAGHFGDPQLSLAEARSGIRLSRRAETLSIEEFAALADALNPSAEEET